MRLSLAVLRSSLRTAEVALTEGGASSGGAGVPTRLRGGGVGEES